MNAADAYGLVRQPMVTRPEGRFTLHSQLGKRGSRTSEPLAIWYPYAVALRFVGVKPAMTGAMQAGTPDVP